MRANHLSGEVCYLWIISARRASSLQLLSGVFHDGTALRLKGAHMSEYAVILTFWGNPFPDLQPNFPINGNPPVPYSSQQLSDKLRLLIQTGYFSILKQYGAGKTILSQANPFFIYNDSWPTLPDGYYVTRFKVGQILDFLIRNFGNSLVTPIMDGSQVIKPIYLVVLPNGSLVDDADPIATKDNGAHYTNSVSNESVIWGWMYANHDIDGGTHLATHEIVEAIGADNGAPKELCDDCQDQNPDGNYVNGILTETYFDLKTGTCIAPGSGWLELDDNSDSVRLLADFDQLYQMHSDGTIWSYTGPPHSGWIKLGGDDNTQSITASNGNLYRLQKNGQILKFVGIGSPTPGPHNPWLEIDNDPNAVEIVADGASIYKRTDSGGVFVNSGVPGTPWLQLDNAGARKIVASGGNLYQLQTGRILKYSKSFLPGHRPHSNWRELDSNPHSADIIADGGLLYQIHDTQVIWKYVGPPHTGWVQVDNNPDSRKIVASGGNLYQMHVTGRMWKYTGSGLIWVQIDANGDTRDIVSGAGTIWQIHTNGRIYAYAPS